MGKKRIPIPKLVANEVMTKSEGNCYCGKRGAHIHHLDEDPSNNNFDNLILLCFEHHHEASIKGGLMRQLTPDQLKTLRNKLYRKNEINEDSGIRLLNKNLKNLTEETLFRASLEATITIEI